MSTAISGRIALLRLRTSTPDMSESDRSTSATSKGVALTWAMASSPVRASPVTSMSTRPEKTCLRPIRTISWSSTIRSRIIAFIPTGKEQEPITPRCPTPSGVGKLGLTCRTSPTSVALERISKDNFVPFHGNVFRLQAGNLGHERPGGLVDDVAGSGVVADGVFAFARGTAALVVAGRGRQELQLVALARLGHERRVLVGNAPGHGRDGGFRLQLECLGLGRSRDLRGGGDAQGQCDDEELHGNSPDRTSGPESARCRKAFVWE